MVDSSTETQSWTSPEMNQFHKVVSKKMWFLLFNVGTTIYVIVSGTVRWDALSILSYVVALGLINFIAWFSARSFPSWK